MHFSARLLLAPLLLSFGCASMYQLTRGSDVPAADGTAKVSKGPNGNSRIQIKVLHLAPPDRVSPGATEYVAWAHAGAGDAQQTQSLGGLRLDSDLVGSLDTKTALTDFDLFITAEISPTVGAPSGPHVLSAHIANH